MSAAILFICMPKNVNHLNFSAVNGQYGTGADDLRQVRYSLFLQIEFFVCVCRMATQKKTKLIYFLHVYLLMALSLSIIQKKRREREKKITGRKCGAALN